MALNNSQVDFLVDQFADLLQDVTDNANGKFRRRDEKTVRSRVASEGISFLTKTLPTLGKHFDEALENGWFYPAPRWSTERGTTRPKFLGDLFNLVFDESGALRSEPSAEAIRSLRQILFYMYKLELPYSTEQEGSTLRRFVETDRELELGGEDALFESASHLIENVFLSFQTEGFIPKHGPGAVATGERAEEKWHFSRIYSNVDRLFPFGQFFLVGGDAELEDRKDWHDSLHRVKDPVAKVVLVPKDSRGPRLISCEPLEIQYVQQGIARKMVDHLEANYLTAGHINFRDQSVNQRLALTSSVDGRYATVDLKDASDRVSLSLVEWLFKRTDLLPYLMATRSTATRLPNGEIVRLSKFAPMGSALCFPVEATCFWALAVAAVIRETRLQLQQVVRHIYVYGDDIIVPVAWLPYVRSALVSAGLLVNERKTFSRGKFRESCGVDAYNGVDVTPTRLRSLPSGRRSDGGMLSNYVSVANSLKAKGYERAAEHLFRYVESVLGHALPKGTPECGFLCRWSSTPARAQLDNVKSCKWRWNAHLQRVEFFVTVVTTIPRDTTLDGWPRLLRNLTSGAGDTPSKTVDRRTARVKRRWRAVYN